jgi:hypothetical protein
MTGTVPTTVAPSSKTWLGIGREGLMSLGLTGTPVLPTNTIPLDKNSYQPEDTPKFLPDESIRGVMAQLYNDIIGVEDATFSFGGPMFLDVGGFWLDNAFGDLSTVGSGTTSSTTVTAALSAGGTVAILASGSGYSSASSVQIDVGSVAEVVVLTSPPAGGTITFGNDPLRFAHGTGVAAAVVSAPYTHKFAILNSGTGQPPTHTLTDYTSLTASTGARSYPSACVSAVDFTGNAEQLLMQKVTGNSWLSAPATSTPTNTTAFVVPQANWRSTVTVGGSQIYNAGEWTASIKRMLQVYWTAQNSQNPYIIARGGLGMTVGLNYSVATSESPLTNMLSAGPLAVQLLVSNGIAVPNAGALSLSINATTAQTTKSKPDRNAVLVGYQDELECVANTTDVGGSGGLGPCTVTLINSIPTY